MRHGVSRVLLVLALAVPLPAFAQGSFIGIGGPGGGGSTTGGGSGGGSFSAIQSGENIDAAMIVTGAASLTVGAGGTINANRFNGQAVIQAIDGGTGVALPLDDAVLIGNSMGGWDQRVLPDCSNATTSKLLYNISTNSWSCGTDQNAGLPSFDQIQTGINTAGSMTVGTGALLTYSGSGSINASLYHGNATIAVADGGTGLTTAADDAVNIGNGTLLVSTVLPSCSNAVTSKLLYDTSTNAFSCGTDQSSGGGTTFDAIGGGTNISAAMLVGTGATLDATGNGRIASNVFWPNILTVNAGNSPYSPSNNDAVIYCDTTAAGRTITLPAATARHFFLVYNLGSNTCTINRSGADTLATGSSTGLTSFVIRNAGSNFWLKSDLTSVWYVGG